MKTQKNGEMQKMITCNQCKRDIKKTEAIKVIIKGDKWYFCNWECLDLFARECLNVET